MMNRIKSLGSGMTRTLISSRPPSGAVLLESDHADEKYALFTPLHYEPNYAYPLVVWLHGWGEDERVVSHIMTQVSLRNYVAIAPRGTLDLQGEAASPAVHGEDDPCGTGFAWRQTSEHVELAQQRVATAIERAASQWNLHEKRLFLAGTGCGGTMALRVALRQPRQFAGALSIDGAFPRQGAPLSRLLEARRLPLFIGSDRLSESYPSASVCDDLRLLHAAGISVTLKQYPGSSLCRARALSDANRWMMETLAEQKEATVVASSRQIH